MSVKFVDMIQATVIVQLLPHFACMIDVVHDERRNPIDFWSKVNFSSLSVKPYWPNTDCTFCQIISKHHMQVLYYERGTLSDLLMMQKVKIIISPNYEGMPCFVWTLLPPGAYMFHKHILLKSITVLTLKHVIKFQCRDGILLCIICTVL